MTFPADPRRPRAAPVASGGDLPAPARLEQRRVPCRPTAAVKSKPFPFKSAPGRPTKRVFAPKAARKALPNPSISFHSWRRIETYQRVTGARPAQNYFFPLPSDGRPASFLVFRKCALSLAPLASQKPRAAFLPPAPTLCFVRGCMPCPALARRARATSSREHNMNTSAGKEDSLSGLRGTLSAARRGLSYRAGSKWGFTCADGISVWLKRLMLLSAARRVEPTLFPRSCSVLVRRECASSGCTGKHSRDGSQGASSPWTPRRRNWN